MNTAARAARAIQGLLPNKLPPSLRTTPANLYQVLSRYPQDGVGQRVHQIRWTEKGMQQCYWTVTKTRLKLEGNHGKAWGKLYWKGKRISEHEERITGSLKYKWNSGAS
ncbi:hypothetical protein SERLA73DRAFT_177042 [Serpula lacrymans var. lacrymans S7.3]|uniref:Uncharacterized protein n=2 Tax=Serpula lacrymans var. lacrymans TaxID=341189 RepID=F8PQR9_SERL3|nr:uncharacterized protein SERLADRAFT_460438 [Serpula lacrymans var. lacrymans S7.9]EGO01629.1 hypothetical protein SERLA73DRAFT_177042 [Serpula lacrymans var. lacrymans S7.3]EGO27283.1 hypothetical protein SERLADRAFT_460438 [Serpula lacrymans var. lacrymans S7.9]